MTKPTRRPKAKWRAIECRADGMRVTHEPIDCNAIFEWKMTGKLALDSDGNAVIENPNVYVRDNPRRLNKGETKCS